MEILLEQWQDKVLFDTHRYKVINAGRRCGKSTAAAISILQFASNYKKDKPGYIWYIAPNYKQAKSIMWQMLLELCPPHRILKKNETELSLQLDTNVTIYLKGAEDPDSLRGNRIDLAIFDEVAFHTKWDKEWAIMRPTLMDSQAECWFISTPNGFNHFKDLYDKVDEKWKSFHFTTYDNSHIDKSEIEQTRSEMSEDEFQQEIMGEFRKMSGLIYKEFNRDIHMVDIPDIQGFTFTRAIDFGFAHKTALGYFAISPDGSQIYLYDGLYESGFTIPQIADAVKIKDAGRIIQNPLADSARPDSIQELSNLGVSFSPVEKDKDSVINGIMKVASLLRIRMDTGKPTLMFNKNLSWIADEFERYRWIENKSADDVIKEAPYKVNDDACFIKGTKILTKRGNISIEQITNEDKVYTPYGWSKVLNTGCTGKRKVKDYKVFISTPNHKIVTNRGIMRVDTIRYSDIIMICKTKQLNGMELIIEDTPILLEEQRDFIFKGLNIRNLEAKQAFYIEKYGNLLMVRFKKDIKFITRMVILLIMKYIILCWLLPKSIMLLIHLILNGIINHILIKLDRSQKRGIVQKMDLNIIDLLVLNLIKIGYYLKRNVLFVEKTTQPILVRANTVIKTVKPQHFAEEEVYNLATDRGMFFANGVLVSNCDMIRYFVMGFKKQEQHIPIYNKKKWGLY